MDVATDGQLNSDLTSIWLLIAGCMVFFMQVILAAWNGAEQSWQG